MIPVASRCPYRGDLREERVGQASSQRPPRTMTWRSSAPSPQGQPFFLLLSHAVPPSTICTIFVGWLRRPEGRFRIASQYGRTYSAKQYQPRAPLRLSTPSTPLHTSECAAFAAWDMEEDMEEEVPLLQTPAGRQAAARGGELDGTCKPKNKKGRQTNRPKSAAQKAPTAKLDKTVLRSADTPRCHSSSWEV